MGDFRPRLEPDWESFFTTYKQLPDDKKLLIIQNAHTLLDKQHDESVYTYLFRSMHLYKIGETDNIKKRFNALVVNNPHDTEIVCFSNQVREKYLQDLMGDFLVCGEWYALPPERVIFIKGLMGS